MKWSYWKVQVTTLFGFSDEAKSVQFFDMKILFSIVICRLTGTGNAQFLKKLSGDISNDIRLKVRAKANHKIDQGLDTLTV